MGTIGRLISKIVMFLIFGVLIAVILYFDYGTPPIQAIPSKSMVPTLNIGDLIIVTPESSQDIQKGDIIVVTVPDSVQRKFHYPSTIVHRVHDVLVANGQKTFKVKGDNNQTEDPFTVYPSNIQGQMITSYAYIGYLILFLDSIQGHYFVYISLALYLIYSFYDEYKRRRLSFRKSVAKVLFKDLFQRAEAFEKRHDEALARILDNLQGKPDLKGEKPTQQDRQLLYELQNDLEKVHTLLKTTNKRRLKSTNLALKKQLKQVELKLNQLMMANTYDQEGKEIYTSEQEVAVSQESDSAISKSYPPRRQTHKRK